MFLITQENMQAWQQDVYYTWCANFDLACTWFVQGYEQCRSLTVRVALSSNSGTGSRVVVGLMTVSHWWHNGHVVLQRLQKVVPILHIVWALSLNVIADDLWCLYQHHCKSVIAPGCLHSDCLAMWNGATHVAWWFVIAHFISLCWRADLSPHFRQEHWFSLRNRCASGQ